jgi:hypothetical protein
MKFRVQITYYSQLVAANTCFLSILIFMHFIVECCMFNFLNVISSHFF